MVQMLQIATSVAQSNGAQSAQNLEAINDCDEEGTGFNFAVCSNNDRQNGIDSITQTNDATLGDDTLQLNFVGMNQDMQFENVCDETGVGDNNAQCDTLSAPQNFIGPVDQSNTATGSGDADFTQNNNIPTINQVIDAQNDCDQADEQSAEGDNFASCNNFAFNNVFPITQINDAEGTHVDDIFQDNTGSFSQIMTLNNGCDATTFSSSGDNGAACIYTRK